MSKEEEKLIDYIVVCINEFAQKFGIDDRESFNYLNKYQVIKFIKEHYEVEHTLSLDDVIDDMVVVAKKYGGALI